MVKHFDRHPLITGTIILTLTGLATRGIGFFYRIFLSNLFGEEGMGLYQLLTPVLALSFSLTGAAYQSAISKCVAEQSARRTRGSLAPLLAGLSVALPLSLLCTAVVFFFSDRIAFSMLQDVRTAPLLRILSFSFPMASVHACINGYFYGIKKTGVPALSQFLEQSARVGSVLAITALAQKSGQTPSINAAVAGLAIGELCSMVISLAAIYLHRIKTRQAESLTVPATPEKLLPLASLSGKEIYLRLFAMVLPLTANRIVLNLLASVETVSIPTRLRLYGYDAATALSVYGVLTGMALPMIFFPNALTGSVSVLLLPTVSENRALGKITDLKQTISRTVKYSFLMGIVCMVFFVSFGNTLGTLLFNSTLAGHFIATLGFVCPFLYLDTTLSGILHGLGMVGRLFLLNVCALLIRLFFVFLWIPKIGITGYLWGVLSGQIFLCSLSLLILRRFLRRMERGFLTK